MHDPTPILCRSCGAPIETGADIELRCVHCGTIDTLPQEARARVRELRRRLEARAKQVAQLSGLALGLAMAFEDPRRSLRVFAPAAALLAFILIVQLPGSLAHIAGAPVEVMPRLIGNLITGMAPVVGLPLAAMFAYLVGRRIYRRDLRDLLRARSPRGPEGLARCRCCGGELPRGVEPLILCPYCRTHSLVTRELQAQQSVAVAADTRFDHQRHELLLMRTARLGRTMDRACYVALALGYVACLVLSGVIAAVIKAIA